METLSLRNIRTIENSGAIRIAPITILVGQNSSGKSTFARFLPLLKQGTEFKTREPILWLGRSVDFGSAEEAHCKFSKENTLGFSFSVNIPSAALEGRRRAWYYLEQAAEQSLVEIDINYKLKDGAPERYLYKFSYKKNSISIEIDEEGSITRLLANDNDRTEFVSSHKLKASWLGAIPTIERDESNSQTTRSAYSELLRFIKPHVDGRTKADRVQNIARNLISLPIDKVAERAPHVNGADAYWKRNALGWAPSSAKLRQLSELVLIHQFFAETLDVIAFYSRLAFSRIQYITPLRARAERYYRLQGLSIEEIDPEGDNVAMYLHNLSSNDRSAFEEWMLRFFGVCVSTKPSMGHVSLVLRESASGEEYNLADTGFGFSQMLPIMIQLWKTGRESQKKSPSAPRKVPTIFAIEQPELHLHPKLQAKLVDVFIAAIRAAGDVGVDLRLVIETHSEQIISALGISTARGEISTDECNIAIFEKQSLSTPTTVREVSIGDNGAIKSWPIGFFDAEI